MDLPAGILTLFICEFKPSIGNYISYHYNSPSMGGYTLIYTSMYLI